MDCPCGSAKSYDECCGPALARKTAPSTAEALMRSRYTAYTRGDVGYLMDTLAPSARKDVNRAETARWARESKWMGLDILSTERGGPGDDDGVVEFRARYQSRGQDVLHHERSRFRREDGVWYYVDGEMVRPPPVARTEPKIGRNDPCHCGSGKKFKKCHGA